MKLEIENVSKAYRGGVEALRSFRLELGSGVLGLLGPNGAGKSTLMRILARITQPSAGRVLKVYDGKIHAVEAFMRILPLEKRNGGWE